MAIQKQGKAFTVLNVIKKLKAYEQKNPDAAPAIKVTVTGLAAAATAAGVFLAMNSGANAGVVQEIAQGLSSVSQIWLKM